MAVDATYTAFLVPIGIAFHFKAEHFSWYNAIDIAAGKASRTGLQATRLKLAQHSCGRHRTMPKQCTMLHAQGSTGSALAAAIRYCPDVLIK